MICLIFWFTFLGPPDDGLISHISSSKQTAMSEDLSSIVSLSDKYRQQEEIEIFHEQLILNLLLQVVVNKNEIEEEIKRRRKRKSF